MFVFTDRKAGQQLTNAFEVSSRGKDLPWKLFSPFSTEFKIPHPCDPSIICPSVEACWQGSKLMPDDVEFNSVGVVQEVRPNYDMMTGKIRWKKGVKPYAMWVGGNRITQDPGISRRIVYVPAYYYFARKVIKKHKLLKQLCIMAILKSKFYLYDFDSNGSLDNPAPISHASILVTLLNSLPNLTEV